MPPGWHVTTGPGAVLYHSAHEALGRFSLEAEIFLFPDSKDAEYGVFVGGAGLEGPAPSYTAFVLRRDGAAAVLERRGDDTRAVVPWSRHDSVAAARPGGTARNVLRIDVDSARFVFIANGARIAELPRGELPARGRFGFRVGAGVDLHASTLDFIIHLAPPRARPGR